MHSKVHAYLRTPRYAPVLNDNCYSFMAIHCSLPHMLYGPAHEINMLLVANASRKGSGETEQMCSLARTFSA